MKPLATTLSLCISLLLFGCNDSTPDMQGVQSTDADSHGFSAPTPTTAASNQAVASQVNLDDERDFADALRGFIARDEGLDIRNPAGQSLWRPADYAFVKDAAPASVNPSLWRQEKLNNLHGLFKVSDRVFQVRGYDLANMTIIEGDQGRILIDPLTATETAQAALALVERELGQRPISAILFTHSHVDHFGGINGVLQAITRQPDATRIIAPAGFMEEAISENILAGTVMVRRAGYMYGAQLPRSERGHVGSGLGKQPALGQLALLQPTDIIDHTGQTLTIDGVTFEFQSVPHSEAPAELTFYLPQWRIWCGAELVSRNLHNLYTLRGAKVRDGLKWSDYIQQALDLFGERSDIIINSHHWPVWGNNQVQAYLKHQRDLYKYIHDQTLRLAGQGHTADEIAEQLQLPDSLSRPFYNRGYYGTVRHNARAVYQFYFGWYDSNPAHLNPLPASVSASRYVDAMGGMTAVLQKAQAAFADGDYRWAAELLNHAVYSDPDHAEAREWLARCYDQLGYQAESGPWRDEYLSGALELRKGIQRGGVSPDRNGILAQIPLPQYFNTIATLLNGPKAADTRLTANFNFTDVNEQYVVWIENAVLHHRTGQAVEADFTLHLTRELWVKLIGREAGLQDLLGNEDLQLEGSKLSLLELLGLLQGPDEAFPIVTPRG